jgi:RHS repeat-associated protein
LGIDTEHIEMIGEQPDTLHRRLGLKQYELSNHLGNVLSVINDIKLPVVAEDGTTIISYSAVVISATDYSAFGFALYGRTWSSKSYRYGFNGKEKDSENFAGAYHFGARIYDGRLGRFLSIDPALKESPWSTPYSFAANKPIWMIDRNGLKGTIYIQVMLDENGKPVIDKKTMKKVKADIEKKYKELGIELKVEVQYSNEVMTKEEFSKRSKFDPTDSYILIGTIKQTKEVNDKCKEYGWEAPWGKDNDNSKVNGTSACNDFFALLNAENLKTLSFWDEGFWFKKAAESHEAAQEAKVIKISTIIQHESMHPIMKEHPGMIDDSSREAKYKGFCGHVPNTIMADYPGYSEGICNNYDYYMAKTLRKIHLCAANAQTLVIDTPEMRNQCLENFMRAHPRMSKEQAVREVNSITTWVAPTKKNAIYEKDKTP